MTVQEIIIEALHDLQNGSSDGKVKWNFIDSDLWLHPDAANFEDQELYDGLNNFPDGLVPIWGEFTPRETHPIP